MTRHGSVGPRSLTWESKHGSLVASGYDISTPDQPNIASTLWRTVADHKNLLYFFESTLTPNTFWVELKDLDLSPEAQVMRLDLGDHRTYAGNAASQFVAAQAFEFAGI